MSNKMREEFEAYRDSHNAALEAEGHKPGSKWHVTQAHYATWEASRTKPDAELKRRDKQCRDGVAAALGFTRGGDFAWSYLLQQIKECVKP